MLRAFVSRAAVVVAFALMAVFSQPAVGGLSLLSDTVTVNSSDKQVVFDMIFSRAPDFATVDSDNQPADAFQFEIVPNVHSSINHFGFDAIRAVIRGTEIGKGSVIPIRDGFENGSDPNPASGGWGKVLGSVPFSLHGSDMKFSVPFNLLGTSDGDFAYRVFTTDYGAIVSQNQGISVPLPPALPAGLIMLGVMVAGFAGRRAYFR